MTKSDKERDLEEELGSASEAEGFDDDMLDPDDIVEVLDLDEDGNIIPNNDDEVDPTPAEQQQGEDQSMDEQPNDAVGGFFDHTDSVYSVAINPKFSELVITGGGDDRAFIWNRFTGAKLHELKGHTDTVLATGFNFNGELAATGALDGTVKIWNTQTGALVSTLEGPQEGIEWLQWHQKGSVVLAGSGDGTAWMWLSNGQCMAVFSGHSGSVTCGEFTCDGRRVATGSDDGSLRVWNPKTAASECLIAGHSFHDGPLTSLSCHPSNASLVITGSQDHTARLVNISTGKVVGGLLGHTDSVESVGFSDPQHGGVANLAASGSVDGTIRIWDTNTLQTRTTFSHDDVVVKVQWRGPLVFSSSADKTVRVWDARQGTPVRVFRGHQDLVHSFAITQDGSHMISVSDDNTALIFPLSS